MNSAGAGFAFFCQQRLDPHWVILVGGGYGAFLFAGTEVEAEFKRASKSSWEAAVAHKRPASFTDLEVPSPCWNHRGFVRLAWYGSRGRLLNKPYTPRFYCKCGACSNA